MSGGGMFWKIGHRGACGHAPENTILSMKKALELGACGFEFDIQLSKDGQPAVIHDDTLERTTNGKGFVSDYTLAELQKLDAGKGERIPSLRDVFDFARARCMLFIELKAHGSEGPVAEIIRHYVTKKGWRYDQIFVCSFDHFQIANIKKMDPQILTCALIAGIPVSLAAIAQEAGAYAINPGGYHLTKELVDDAHWRGLKVYTWTLNHPRHIERARALGVDGIMSDFPERL